MSSFSSIGQVDTILVEALCWHRCDGSDIPLEEVLRININACL